MQSRSILQSGFVLLSPLGAILSVSPLVGDVVTEPLRTIVTPSTVHGADISPDGLMIAAGSGRDANRDNDNIGRLWDAATGSLAQEFVGHAHYIQSIAYSPDGTQVLTGGLGTDSTVRLWDASTGNQLKLLEGHSQYIYKVEFLPDGTRAVSASRDTLVILWDLSSGNVIRNFDHDSGVYSMALTPDGTQLVTGQREKNGVGGVFLWNINSGQFVRQFVGHTASVWATAVSPDGQRAATGSSDFSVRIWDIATGNLIYKVDLPSGNGTRDIKFSPDGRFLLLGGSGGGDRAYLWDAATGQELRRFSGMTAEGLRVAEFFPDGRKVLTGSDNILKIWDISDLYPQPNLRVTASEQGSEIQWDIGTLQSTHDIASDDWTDLDSATSPLSIQSIGEKGFFRVKVND